MYDKLFKIDYDSKCGRQLIATRYIKAGELVISEPPIVHGPGYSTSRIFCATSNLQENNGTNTNNEETKSLPLKLEEINVCVICYQNLKYEERLNLERCDKCGLYLCSNTCCLNPTHVLECKIFQKYSPINFANFKSLFNFITVIRCLFNRSRDKIKWKQIISLQSKWKALEKVGAFTDLEDAFRSLQWPMFEEGTYPFKEDTQEKNAFSEVNEDDIIRTAKHCLGVMRINAFSHFSGNWSREGLYFLSSFMSHSCIMNTDRQMTQDGTMIVRAAVDIEECQPITTCYSSYLNNNIERKLELDKNWLFFCNCRRCQCPSELGTFMSNVCCPFCGKDAVQPITDNSFGQISESTKMEISIPTGNEVMWKCSSSLCGAVVPNATVTDILQTVETSKPTSLANIDGIEKWLKTFDTGKILHRNHSIFIHVKFLLCQLYGRNNNIEPISCEQLCRKAELCYELLTTLNCLFWGIYQFRGIIMFELWNCVSQIILLSQNDASLLKFTQEKNWTEKYLQDLKTEALNILQYACQNSSEESMAFVMQESN